MRPATLTSSIAANLLGLIIAGGTSIGVQPARASGNIMLAGLSPTIRMVSATDFWDKTGATSKHDLDAEAVAELEKIIKAGDHPALALRAAKLLCDNQGHTRANDSLSDAENARAVTVAFEYLESHLAEPAIAKFAPERGFSHLTVSRKTNDPAAWILIETAALPPSFNGGLNIQVDLKTVKVKEVTHWGDIRPGVAKP